MIENLPCIVDRPRAIVNDWLWGSDSECSWQGGDSDKGFSVRTSCASMGDTGDSH